MYLVRVAVYKIAFAHLNYFFMLIKLQKVNLASRGRPSAAPLACRVLALLARSTTRPPRSPFGLAWRLSSVQQSAAFGSHHLLDLRARSSGSRDDSLIFHHLHHHLITLFLTTKINLTTRKHSLTIKSNRS